MKVEKTHESVAHQAMIKGGLGRLGKFFHKDLQCFASSNCKPCGICVDRS